MIPAMKPSPFDTFCRALVLGAVLGALGWGAVRYTNLPQIALRKIVTLSQQLQDDTRKNHLSDSSVISSSTPAPPLLGNQLQSIQSDDTAIKNIPQVTPGILHHPTQQAAYLEPTVPSSNGTQPFSQTENIRQAIEQRLGDLGAVYSLLEMWGNENIQYRFHCRVSIANNRQVTRSFEANGTSPESAMQQVLKEVEGFQSTSSLQGTEVR